MSDGRRQAGLSLSLSFISMVKGHDPALMYVRTHSEELCLGTEPGAYLLCVYLHMNLVFVEQLSLASLVLFRD